MRIKFIAWYSLLLGISVLGMWGGILTTGELPEGPVELTFHLISEFLMAILAVAAGILLFRNNRLGRSVGIAAHGMVVYSVLNASGYYAERGEFVLPIIFLILMLASALSINLLVIKKEQI